MPLTKIQSGSFETGAIDTSDLSSNATIAFSSTSAFANALAPKITTVNVANSAFSILDDTAVNIGGGYIVVTGANFQSGASVLIDTTPASAVTFVNTSILRVQVPARPAASYNLYVVNPDGGTGIRVAGLNYSTEPIWVTSSPLSNQAANTAFNVTLSATGATSYAVAAGSTLPDGTTLAANGYFSGTVSISTQTTYSFSVVATDAELQDSSKTFQVTVTVVPPRRLYSWGQNMFGVLGVNDVNARSSPTQIDSGTTWSLIKTNGYSAFAIKNDGTLWAWGRNELGSLGRNDTIHRSSPVQVGAGTNWSKIDNGSNSALAIKTDGTLWSWGRNDYGTLGTNDRVYRSSPVQIGAGTNWNEVATNFSAVMAIKTDGTLWSWGSTNSGVLGLNTDTIHRSSPVQVGAGTNWSLVDVGIYATIAIKTDGTLWSWGRNNFDQLGQNNAIYRSSPTQVGSATNWNKISFWGYTSLAIKTDGTLWSWGYNVSGQTGLNSTTTIAVPTQIGVATNWSTIAIGFQTSLAIKTDGTLWLWGNNDYGQQGQNNRVSKSSPTQVGASTNWSSVTSGQSAAMAITSG